MPIISEIGKRSIKVRLLYTVIFLILIAGAITMIYPLMLMLSGSVRSEADSWSIKPYPEFWFNDKILFQKYAESKYNVLSQQAQTAWCTPVKSWRNIEIPEQLDPEIIRCFREWRATIPAADRSIGHISGGRMLPKNLRSYRSYMALRFNNVLSDYNKASNQYFSSWCNVVPPTEKIGRYRNRSLPEEFRQEMIRWRATVNPRDINVVNVHGSYSLGFLYGVYTSRIDAYNKAHGTSFRNYGEIPLSARVPPEAGLVRDDWTKFVRNQIALSSIRLDPAVEPSFRKFISQRYSSAGLFNKEHNTAFAGLEEVPFPARIDDAPYLRRDFESFIKSPEYCPDESISVVTRDGEFRDYLAGKLGRVPESYPGLGAVSAAADWADCMDNKAAVRWEFTMRNYWQVIDYLAMHGNGLLNTAIYCLLAVATALIVNPLAAYALSRFRLPGTYKILLFCMATMAFPGEVTMIPGFLLLKRFPLFPIIGGLLVTIVVFLLSEKLLPRWKENWRAMISLAAGLLVGGILIPSLGPGFATTSLLNNFAALVLPGMANGFSIFLLKGFFDSMPKELYEAADIDGANEWTKFWMLTMNLSKPILAVIALGAFTHAYSAFMMALIIIPDQKMWTIMVWIFQLQNQVHPSVVYASLVIAAIPTFTIFVLCQNVIMRGIVVPTEK